jgi:hypothetical protein
VNALVKQGKRSLSQLQLRLYWTLAPPPALIDRCMRAFTCIHGSALISTGDLVVRVGLRQGSKVTATALQRLGNTVLGWSDEHWRWSRA